jgi:peptidyl-prolyl cis-trans isomerase SurA
MTVKHWLPALLLIGGMVIGQNSKKEVLFTVDDKPYYTDEFSRVYKKNLDLVKDESQKDLDQYLDLFIGYKLKINKAYKLGLQNGSQYQTELRSYRNQLAKNYLTDSKVTNELVQEGYNRSLKEVNASHILLMLDENAAPADTLRVYNQMLDIRNRVLKGEDFGKLANQMSQDPSAKENNGDLGWFSAFRMVYPFESAAYKTPKGQISMPIRTRFGYHLVKVNDIRDNRGEVNVAHIMILKPVGGDAEAQAKARNTIQDIYKKLQQGESFAELAKQFSDDKSSSTKGGNLNRFGSGQLSSEAFENVAFGLKNPGDISEPFETEFGWHIVKLHAKHALKTYDELRPEIEAKVGKDERSRLAAESMNEKLRKQFPVRREAKIYTAATKAVTDKWYEGTWALPEQTKAFDGKLFQINDKVISGTDFLRFVEGQQKIGSTIRPVAKLVDDLYQKFVDQQLNQYYNDNLETQFPEFGNVMDEYRDGLLLFELMEKEIWEKSKTDTVGLQKFYDLHKDRYQWKDRLDVIIASSTQEKFIKQAQKMLKQGKTADEIKSAINTSDLVNVMTNSGVFEKGSEVLPKDVPFKEGMTDIIRQGEYYFVVKVNKVLPAGPKTLDEARGRVINDYQQSLEENWVQELRKEFSVNVDKKVFEKVKSELKS